MTRDFEESYYVPSQTSDYLVSELNLVVTFIG
jgi:hypothetical protein